MVTPKQIVDVLKKLNYSNIKLIGQDRYKPITYRNHNNKTVKGIMGGSYGPMTLTDAYVNHTDEVQDKVIDTLKELGLPVLMTGRRDFTFSITIGKKTQTYMFWWDDYPTYHRSANLDLGYKTQYMLVTITK